MVDKDNQTHDAILQTLNRDIGGYMFGVDAFQQNVADWNGIPLVYAATHPDMKMFTDDPETALKNINGQIVGSIQDAHIVTEGHPRLMGKIVNTHKDVAAMIMQGVASISTGFQGFGNNENEITEVIPNHVLIFKEDAENMPKDHGAFILNKQEFHGHTVDTEVQNMEDTRELSKEIAIANKKIGDITSKLDIANKANEDMSATGKETDGLLEVANKTIAERDATIEGLDTKIKDFEQKEADALVATREDQWKTIKDGIPVGLTHKEEDEKALRAEWESDPYAFSVKMLNFKQKAEQGESGAEFNQTDIDESASAIAELKSLTGRV